MDIEQAIKDELKNQKLQQLKRQYYTLEMDKVGHEAIGMTDAAAALQKRMDDIQVAYDAILAMP